MGLVHVLHRRRIPGHHLLTSLAVLTGISSSSSRRRRLSALGRLQVLHGAKTQTTRSKLLYMVEVLLGGRAILSHIVRIAQSQVLNTSFIQCYEIFILFLDGTNITQQNMPGGYAWSGDFSSEANNTDYIGQQSFYNEPFLTPPPNTQEPQPEDPQSFIQPRQTRRPNRLGWTAEPTPPLREARPRAGRRI